ncbi:MAG: AAA family ATPase [Culicoidibacterales bacterium]
MHTIKRVFLYEKNQYLLFREQEIKKNNKLLSSSMFLSEDRVKELNDSIKSKENIFIDISSMVAHAKDDQSKIILFEQLLNFFDDSIIFICDEIYKEDIYLFRYIFDFYSLDYVTVNDSQIEHCSKKCSDSKKRIVDIDDSHLDAFFSLFESNLYGHNQFKEEFREKIKLFRIFNKIDEHKILSLFLMGSSGVGKTEVARCIHLALEEKTKIARINFSNYSSKDALNSLIGSPRGYVGSDAGELIKRIKESTSGLILIDEFEKADKTVYNFFLDLLENGTFVDSQGDEYNLEGYIIVFTSNVNEQEFREKISPELRSRFDYICRFDQLSNIDKRAFVKDRVNQMSIKYQKHIGITVLEEIRESICNDIAVEEFRNMRELGRVIKKTFVNYVEKKTGTI